MFIPQNAFVHKEKAVNVLLLPITQPLHYGNLLNITFAVDNIKQLFFFVCLCFETGLLFIALGVPELSL